MLQMVRFCSKQINLSGENQVAREKVIKLIRRLLKKAHVVTGDLQYITVKLSFLSKYSLIYYHTTSNFDYR